MQTTDQTRRLLGGQPDRDGYREVRSDYLTVSRQDIEDPVVGIAARTRWLFYKYIKIPKKAEKNVFNVIKNYHSSDKDGEKYAKSVQ